MTHISKKKLSVDQLDKLYSEFLEVIQTSLRKNLGKEILNEVLTPTEKVMITKRFTLVALLIKEVPIMEISRILSMSPATVEKIKLKLEFGKLDTTRKILKQKKKWEAIELFILTTGGLMPPKVGAKRVRELKKKLGNKTS